MPLLPDFIVICCPATVIPIVAPSIQSSNLPLNIHLTFVLAILKAWRPDYWVLLRLVLTPKLDLKVIPFPMIFPLRLDWVLISDLKHGSLIGRYQILNEGFVVYRIRLTFPNYMKRFKLALSIFISFSLTQCWSDLSRNVLSEPCLSLILL